MTTLPIIDPTPQPSTTPPEQTRAAAADPLPPPEAGAMAATNLALVSETFVSLQGEGVLAGTPSWFLRLSGCNLRCHWCDTPYASWAPEGEKRSVDDLLDEAAQSGVRHAVLTGGEPMISPHLGRLCEGLMARHMHVTIETAGTVAPPPAPSDRHVPFDLLSISPKLSNSTPWGDHRDPSGEWARRHEERRLNLHALQSLISQARARRRAHGPPFPFTASTLQFKFVVTGPDDLVEIDDILGRLTGWRPHEIYLMPEGTATPDPEEVRWVIETCIERNWRYGHRLHIELFGDTRGT